MPGALRQERRAAEKAAGEPAASSPRAALPKPSFLDLQQFKAGWVGYGDDLWNPLSCWWDRCEVD